MKTLPLFVILMLFAQFLFAQQQPVQRGMKPVQVTIEGATTTLYKQSHALLIGVSAYNYGLPPLPGVIGDINSVKSLLDNLGFSTTVVMNPTSLELQKAFTDFIAKYGQGLDNRLLFYYAGHGYTEKMPYGDDIGYICPVDAPDPHKDAASFQTKAIPMRTIETYAYQIKSKHALFLFDACFSGSIFSTSRAIPEVINYKTKEPVRQFITSGSANETVPDKSIFRSQLERALKGEADLNKDGFITGSELGDFLQTTVVNYTSNYQHPQYGKIRNPNLDKGDFVFVTGKPGQTVAAAPVISEPVPVTPTETISEKSLVRYGSIEITTRMAGKLYIDDVYKKDVNANSLVTINNITEGDHSVKVIGDETVEKTVSVSPEQSAAVTIDKSVSSAAGLPEMVYVQGGTFQMGSNDGYTDEKPVHQVTVNSFYLGKYEVTVAQFKKFIDETGYRTDADKGGGSYVITSAGEREKRAGVDWRYDARGNQRSSNEYNHPVIHVSWNDANEYCSWLSRKTGKTYRLPTETEWEYAAGNGSKHTKYSWGDGDSNGKKGGNVADESPQRVFTSPVGSFKANDFGLYDMTGNVWEWCNDWYDEKYYSSSPSYNPQGPSSGYYRVLRGGSWDLKLSDCRTGNRLRRYSDFRDDDIGFRVSKADETVEKTVNVIPEQNVSTVFEKTNKELKIPTNSIVDKNIPENSVMGTNKYALIIGNEDYSKYQPGISTEINVPFARNDAVVFKEYVVRTLGYPEKNVYLLTDATAGAINQKLYLISKLASMENGNAELLFYYAGHGLPDEYTRIPFLIPVDVGTANINSAIKLSEIYNKFAETNARKISIFLDACFSGGARESGLLSARSVKLEPAKTTLYGNLFVFSATSGIQSNMNYARERHRIFTYFILKKLQESNGNLTYKELTDYVIKNVSIESLKENEKEQIPSIDVSPDIANKWQNWYLR